jgi:lipoprotein-anchoring transpeptidase ErfK/SrfK
MRIWRRSLVCALVGAPVALAASGCGAAPDGPDVAGAADFQPAAPPTGAGPPQGRWATARLLRRVTLRAAPRRRAKALAHVRPRTEFGSPRVLGVVRHHGAWIAVQSPQLANGRLGWIRARATRPGATDLSIHVDRSRRRLVLRDRGRVVQRMTVAVGRPGNATPLGRFAVTDRLHTKRADSPYGCCAIALTGHQTHLPPGWPGGDRLAIHATLNAASIGQAASLGCVRAPTEPLRRLMRRVPLGTPVFVRP